MPMEIIKRYPALLPLGVVEDQTLQAMRWRRFVSGWQWSSMQPQADQLEKSFNLDTVIQQIDHLLESQSSLLASRRELRDCEN